MQTNTRVLQQSASRSPGLSLAGRDKQGAGQQMMLDFYLPAEKAEKFTSYDALASDTASWRAAFKARGVYEADLQRMSKAADDYLPVLRKALDQHAFADPKAFLRTLDTSELAALQHLHSLADPISVDGLSQEGALNLLLPPNDARMDTDGDGLVSVGAARTITFPPGNAPKDVDDAWAEATEGVDLMTQLHMQMSMHLAPPAGLIAFDGMVVGGGRSRDAGDIASFRSQVARALTGLEISRRFQNEQQRAFTDRISQLLEKFDRGLGARAA